MDYKGLIFKLLIIFGILICGTKPQESNSTTRTKPCGGFLQPRCPINANETNKSKPCGGWFQPACEQLQSLREDTQIQNTSNCGGIFGYFQSACSTNSSANKTSTTKSCGWFNCTDDSSQPQGMFSSIFSNVYDSVGSVTSKILSTTLNTGVDFLLSQVKLFARVADMDTVPLPDVEVSLYPGAFLKTTGGYFKSISAISRGGDIVVSRDGLAFIIEFPIEIKNMEIGFKKFKLALLLGLGLNGEMKVRVKKNKINIRLRLQMSSSCAINVEKVEMTVLDGLEVQMKYCKRCPFVTDKGKSNMANNMKGRIIKQVESQIDSILKKALSENSLICSKFM